MRLAGDTAIGNRILFMYISLSLRGSWVGGYPFSPGFPIYLTAHLGDVPGGVPEKTDKWFRWVAPFIPPIWNRAKRVAAVSIFTKNLALQRYPVPIQVIPNGVSTNEFDPGLNICT